MEFISPITTNGSYTFNTEPGRKYIIGVSFSIVSGFPTIGITWNNGGPDVPLAQSFTDSGAFEFMAPGKQLTFDVENVSGEIIHVTIAPVR